MRNNTINLFVNGTSWEIILFAEFIVKRITYKSKYANNNCLFYAYSLVCTEKEFDKGVFLCKHTDEKRDKHYDTTDRTCGYYKSVWKANSA